MAAKIYTGLLLLCLLALYACRDQIVFALDLSSDTEIQGYVVRMPVNWHAYGRNTGLGSMSFVESKSLPISDPGHIHFNFLGEIDEVRKKRLLGGASSMQNFPWGTVYVIPGKVVSEVNKMPVALTQPIIFVPEFNLILDVLKPDDLRKIRDIRVRSKSIPDRQTHSAS